MLLCGGDWTAESSRGKDTEVLMKKSECLIVILKTKYMITYILLFIFRTKSHCETPSLSDCTCFISPGAATSVTTISGVSDTSDDACHHQLAACSHHAPGHGHTHSRDPAGQQSNHGSKLSLTLSCHAPQFCSGHCSGPLPGHAASSAPWLAWSGHDAARQRAACPHGHDARSFHGLERRLHFQQLCGFLGQPKYFIEFTILLCSVFIVLKIFNFFFI